MPDNKPSNCHNRCKEHYEQCRIYAQQDPFDTCRTPLGNKCLQKCNDYKHQCQIKCNKKSTDTDNHSNNNHNTNNYS